MTTRKEEVYVLYGSQTGNSEQAAQDFCDQATTRLSASEIKRLTGAKDEIVVETKHMQLDDFLEVEQAKWTRLIVIIVSSYGIGQAPLGGYRFRELCDAWKGMADDGTLDKPLEGVTFALCGLGDSKYPTYFNNPTAINEALQLAGAKRAGVVGKADASGTGDNAQSKVVDGWIADIWKSLAPVVASAPLTDENLKTMQKKTITLCREINPDFPVEKKGNPSYLFVLVSIVVAVLAAVIYKFVEL